MKSLLLSPHHDDAELFASWTILRYKPDVVICLRSDLQEARGTGITNMQRVNETNRALFWLGDPNVQFLPFSDVSPDWDGLAEWMQRRASEGYYDQVFAPAVEDEGHEQHNKIGALAAYYFPEAYKPYLTYRRGHGRSTGTEVEFEPSWPAQKLRALSCYESQIAEPSTAYWFIDSGLREYVPET